jgi:hypothetical protein
MNIVLTLTSLSRMAYKGTIDTILGKQQLPYDAEEGDYYILGGSGSVGSRGDMVIRRKDDWLIQENCARNEGRMTISSYFDELCHPITAGSGLYQQAEVKPVKSNCDNCGGTVSNRVCEYCKTEY